MSEVGWFVASAVGLGVAYAAVPGVVNAESMRRGLAGGFRPAALVQVGSLVGDVAWAVLGLSGAALLLRHEAVGLALGLIGAAFLFGLARTALIEAFGRRSTPAPAERGGGDLAVGAIFSLANPAGLAFWTGLGGGVLATGGGEASAGRAALFLLGFAVGALLWGCGLAALVGWGRRFAGGRVLRWLNALCGLALAAFGVRLLWTTLRRAGRWAPWLVRGWT